MNITWEKIQYWIIVYLNRNHLLNCIRYNICAVCLKYLFCLRKYFNMFPQCYVTLRVTNQWYPAHNIRVVNVYNYWNSDSGGCSTISKCSENILCVICLNVTFTVRSRDLWQRKSKNKTEMLQRVSYQKVYIIFSLTSLSIFLHNLFYVIFLSSFYKTLTQNVAFFRKINLYHKPTCNIITGKYTN